MNTSYSVGNYYIITLPVSWDFPVWVTRNYNIKLPYGVRNMSFYYINS